MATVIRLQRGGRKKRPFYSVVVMDKRNRRDGAFIEKVGYYDPCKEPDVIELNMERVKAWTNEGAQVSPRVASLIKLVENPELVEKARAMAEQKLAGKQAAAEAKARAEADAAARAEKEAVKAAEEAAKAAEAEAAVEAPVEEAPVEETVAAEAPAEASAEEAGEAEATAAKPAKEKKPAAKKDEKKADA